MEQFSDEFEKLNDTEKKDINELMNHLLADFNSKVCTNNVELDRPKRTVDEIFKTMSENVSNCWNNYLNSIAKSIQAD